MAMPGAYRSVNRHQPVAPAASPGPQVGQAETQGANGISYLLTLHFLGLAGLPGAGMLDRPPVYELIVQAAGAAKRLRPRVPAPPPGVLGGGAEEVDIRKLIPASKDVLRLDERLSLRLAEPAPFLQVDVWEERTGLFDFGGKAPAKKLLGQCYVPLEQKFSRRPCTWSIVNAHGEKEHSPEDVGYLCLKFGLATSPLPVRNLRIVEGTTASTEVCLAWDPPANDGGTPLRGYRVEARQAAAVASRHGPGFAEEPPRTASAPAVAEPSVAMRGLRGNTEYSFHVWPVSEAGPGPSSDVLGRTGPVAPGVCGTLRSLGGEVLRSEAPIYVEWGPPTDTGGAAIVAYRLRLRPLHCDSLGDVYPAEAWIDLGLTEHRGEPAELQRASVQREKLPPSAGCLCSVAALNAAGCTGPPTKEVPVFFESRAPDSRQAWDFTPESGASREWLGEPCSSQGLPSNELGSPPPRESPAQFLQAAPATLLAAPAPELGGGSSWTGYSSDVAGAYSGWDVDEVDDGSTVDADGGSGVPGVCGTPSAVAGDALCSEAPLYVEWRPPADAAGGATVVAYRLSLRPLFYNDRGDAFPGESSIDLGLTVHQGGPADTQSTSVQCDRLPPCPGCLCSVTAINAAGISGPSTREVPVFFDGQAAEQRSPWDVASFGSGGSVLTRPDEFVTDGFCQLPPSEPIAGSWAVPGTLLREKVSPPSVGGDLYAQAVRALQQPVSAGGMPQGDVANGVPMTPQHRILRNNSVANYGPVSRAASGQAGAVHVQTLQEVPVHPSGGAGGPARLGAATFGMGSRGALVAGRPKPAG